MEEEVKMYSISYSKVKPFEPPINLADYQSYNFYLTLEDDVKKVEESSDEVLMQLTIETFISKVPLT